MERFDEKIPDGDDESDDATARMMRVIDDVRDVLDLGIDDEGTDPLLTRLSTVATLLHDLLLNARTYGDEGNTELEQYCYGHIRKIFRGVEEKMRPGPKEMH